MRPWNIRNNEKMRLFTGDGGEKGKLVSKCVISEKSTRASKRPYCGPPDRTQPEDTTSPVGWLDWKQGSFGVTKDPQKAKGTPEVEGEPGVGVAPWHV